MRQTAAGRLQVLPDGYSLDTAFVHTSQLDQVEAAAAEALASRSWADLQQLLPSVLSAADVSLLLHECPTVENLGAAAALL